MTDEAMSAPDEYEFEAFEDAVCGETSKWTRLAGIIQFVVGVVLLFAGVFQVLSDFWKGANSLVTAIVALVVGTTLMSCATALKAIVTTEGNDISNLMTAIDAIKKAFRIQVIVVVVSTAVGVVVYLAGVL